MTVKQLQKKVFILDDDHFFTEIVLKSLEPYDYIKATAFLSIDELINSLTRKPDIIILDYFLNEFPGNTMQGDSVLARILSTVPDQKVIMLSSTDNCELLNQCLLQGAAGYVIKSQYTAKNIIDFTLSESYSANEITS